MLKEVVNKKCTNCGRETGNLNYMGHANGKDEFYCYKCKIETPNQYDY